MVGTPSPCVTVEARETKTSLVLGGRGAVMMVTCELLEEGVEPAFTG